ncbi:MAG: phage tail protein [Rhodospirillaceae bacterium]|nr:phage tail protein [Rhodospirillales bacterium]
MSEAYIGEIRIFAGNFAPLNWQACDGQLMPVNQNEALFSLLGTTYGGDGVNTFGLPNLKGRVPVGYGQGTGLSNRPFAQTFGATSVTLTQANYPAHTHAVTADAAVQTTTCNATGHLWGQSLPSGSLFAYVDGATNPALTTMASVAANAGTGLPHENMQPYAVVTMIIATLGMYPTRP